MRSGCRGLWLGAVAIGVTLGCVWAARPAGAAAGGEDVDVDVDDPKMARLYHTPPSAAKPATVAPPRGGAALPVPVPAAAPVKREANRPEVPKPAAAKAEVPKAEVPKAEAPKPAAAKPELPKPGLPKPEAPKQTAAATAPPKGAPPGVAAAKLGPPKAAAAKPEGPPAAPASTAPPSSPVPPPPVAEGAKPTAPSVDVAARPSAEREGERPAADREWPYAPRLKLAYRRFPFAHVGAASGTTAPASESFESLSLDVYPMSWYLRVGLSTQFGWESEKFDRSGDYFIAETASVGFQWPGRFTPFVEGLAGGGYMRRVMADLNLPTAYWQVGVDAGVEIYLAKRAYVSLAVGYLHPGNLFVMQSTLMSVKADSWSLKFGVGI